MTTIVTRLSFTKQHQTCKTKTKTDCLVSDRSCSKTDGLRPHHCLALSSDNDNDNDKRLGLTAKADQPDHKKYSTLKIKN